jgi:hypothetical protein
MDAQELIAEGERLARPCLILSDKKESGKYTGVWGGEGILKSGPGSWMHWITIDCGWLSKQGIPLNGLLSVYTDESDESTTESGGIVVHDPSRRLPRKLQDSATMYNRRAFSDRTQYSRRPDKLDGVALYGREAMSFPPLDAVFKYGGPAVKKWLRSLGMPRPEQWDPYFQARKLAEPYDDEFRKRCQLYDFRDRNRIAAILSGWHMPFDDDWDALTRKRLVLWTLWNSEPWVEVWLSKSGSFQVMDRIT